MADAVVAETNKIQIHKERLEMEVPEFKMPWSGDRLERMKYLLETGFLSDAVLYVGHEKQEVRVHRFVLESSSRIFYKDFQKVANNQLTIEDVDPEIFRRFLRHLYLEDFEATVVEDCFPLLTLASKYEIQNLMDFCAKKLNDNITTQNVISLFQHAMEIGHKQLIGATLPFFCRNASKLVESDGFLTLRPECLYELLQRDDLMVKDELQIFNAVLRWGKMECSRQKIDPGEPKNLRKVLEKVLGLIRFPVMDAEEFTLNVAMQNILEDQELISLLLFFNVSMKNRPTIPQGRFNSSRRQYNVLGNKLHTVQRSTGRNCQTILRDGDGEILLLRVNIPLILHGLQLVNIFRYSYWDDGSHEFKDFGITVSIESIESGSTLLRQVKMPFNAFQPLSFESSVELEANSTYSITATLSGKAAMMWTDKKYYDFSFPGTVFQVGTGFQSRCKVGCEEEGVLVNAEFEFSRLSPAEMPITEGLIQNLIFKIV